MNLYEFLGTNIESEKVHTFSEFINVPLASKEPDLLFNHIFIIKNFLHASYYYNEVHHLHSQKALNYTMNYRTHSRMTVLQLYEIQEVAINTLYVHVHIRSN